MDVFRESVTRADDINGDGATGIENVKLFLERNPHTRTPHAGSGDFRSTECVELLKQADIPPSGSTRVK